MAAGGGRIRRPVRDGQAAVSAFCALPARPVKVRGAEADSGAFALVADAALCYLDMVKVRTRQLARQPEHADAPERLSGLFEVAVFETAAVRAVRPGPCNLYLLENAHEL